MRNYTVAGRTVGINERELVCFRGVARGGILVVKVGEGPSDIKIASFSRLGFDRSPNREDLIRLIRKGLMVLIPVNGRIQVGLTSEGRTIAQSMGVFSLACMVRDERPVADRDAAPVVAEERIYTAADFEVDPRPEPVTESAPEVPGARWPPGTVQWKGDAPPALTDEELDQRAAAAEAEAKGVDLQEGDDSEDDPDEVVQPDAGDAEETEKPVYDPMPADDAKFADLKAYAAKHDIDTTGMRSKAAVRAAIEAVVLGE